MRYFVRILIAVGIVAALTASTRAQSPNKSIIVTMKNGQGIGRINNQYGTQTLATVSNAPIYLVSSDADPDTMATSLSADPGVVSAEVNAPIQLGAADLPPSSINLGQVMDDLLDGETMTTFYGTNVLNLYANQPALGVIHATGLSKLSTGAATRVAYIDTGVDALHPALQPWLDPTIDLVSNGTGSELANGGLQQVMDDLLDQVMDDLLDGRFFYLLSQPAGSMSGSTTGSSLPTAMGHGTMVAGLIHVVAPQARILPIKAFDAWGNTSMFTIVQGVYSAIDAGGDVLNMSFSTTQQSPAFKKALDQAHAAGIALVAAAGNDATNTGNRYPAAYPNVTGVAATDNSDHLAAFSNYGGGVSLTAPGVMVVSTAPGGRYALAWGTSFSAPIVSGSMALVASLRGAGSPDSQMILNFADSIDALNPGYAKELGKGRLNVQRALGAGQ